MCFPTRMNVNFELCDSIREGNIQRLREMMDGYGAGLDLRFNPDPLLHPLHYAVREQHFEVIDYLLDNGADINWGPRAFITPLEDLLVQDVVDWEMVEFLVNRGAILGDSRDQSIGISDEIFQKFTEIFEFNAVASNIKG